MHLTIQESNNLLESQSFATHALYVTRQKDTEPNCAHSNNAYDPGNPIVKFSDFFDGEFFTTCWRYGSFKENEATAELGLPERMREGRGRRWVGEEDGQLACPLLPPSSLLSQAFLVHKLILTSVLSL